MSVLIGSSVMSGLADAGVPLSILGSGIAGVSASPTTGTFSDSITVPAGTTALIFAGCVLDPEGGATASFETVAFNSDAMTEVIPMDAAAINTAPGWTVWKLLAPSIGTFNLTGNRITSLTRDARLWVAIGGDVHSSVVGTAAAPTPSSSNVDPRSVAITTAYADSICIAGSCSQGEDTDPMTGADDVDAILQTDQTGGTSTTADIGFAIGWGATPATGAKTFTFDAAASDGGQAFAIEIRPA